MINAGKRNIGGILVNVIDLDAAVDEVVDAARRQQPLAVTNLAVHGVMTGRQDAEQRYRLNHFDLVLPDGQPVRWALNWLHGAGLASNVRGTAFTLAVCRAAARESLPVYLYGSRQDTLDRLGERLLAEAPGLRIAGTQPSRFRSTTRQERAETAREIHDSGARLVLVGLGCPRQETWAYEFRDLLPIPILAVGAAFDFISGGQQEAPELLQQAGLEWLHRLVHEPRRLWRRYALLNPAYIATISAQMIARDWDTDGVPPSAEMVPG